MWNPSTQWEPKTIARNIICIQACYYAMPCLVILVLSFFFLSQPDSRSKGGAPSLADYLFDSHALSFSYSLGYVPVAGYLASAFPLAFIVCLVVQRAKKVLDYVCTTYALHLLVCTAARHFPSNWHWYAVHAACFLITAVLSEYLCVQREMRPIQIGSYAKRKQRSSDLREADLDGASAAAAASHFVGDSDEEGDIELGLGAAAAAKSEKRSLLSATNRNQDADNNESDNSHSHSTSVDMTGNASSLQRSRSAQVLRRKT